MLLGFPTKCFMIVQIRVLTQSGIPLPMRSSKMGSPSSSFWTACLISSLDSFVRQLLYHYRSFPVNPKTVSSMTSKWNMFSFRQLLATMDICQILFRISCFDKPSMFHLQSLPEETENWLLTFLSSNWRSRVLVWGTNSWLSWSGLPGCSTFFLFLINF